MHPILKQLSDDHLNFSRLLKFLSSQVGYSELKSHWDDNLPQVLDSFDYIRGYPDKWHHPIEDIAFARLQTRLPDCQPQVQDLIAEHSQLEQKTRKLQQLFQSVANDCIVPAELLSTSLRQFIDAQSSHIAKENSQIYPLLREHLTDEDWAAIAEEVEAREDPLFGAKLRQEYESLFRSLFAESGNPTA